MSGIGIAVGGLVGTGVAGPAVAILTIIFWAFDIIAPALGLPKVLNELALSAHYGLPMLGQWDAVGIVTSIAVAVGGVALGAVGFNRRDLAS
jgi:putative exporter of polyketide antibiotics